MHYCDLFIHTTESWGNGGEDALIFQLVLFASVEKLSFEKTLTNSRQKYFLLFYGLARLPHVVGK